MHISSFVCNFGLWESSLEKFPSFDYLSILPFNENDFQNWPEKLIIEKLCENVWWLISSLQFSKENVIFNYATAIPL